ncbi:hypothetical protein [Variovorax sp. UC74_104]|uniref:hypothetical protein n=1 Tax=Variovorax sp. UC74_104 TaxID=3374555 RepID=UPI0037581EF3
MFSHFDLPAPGVGRLTSARLSKDKQSVKAFLACIMNGEIDGSPCMSVGYAVPEEGRNKGLAKQIFREVIQDQLSQARKAGPSSLFIEAVVDIENVPSQRVAETVLGVERESITDAASGRAAYRYTAHFDTVSGRQL